jgi:predicted dehydrogenase
MKKIKAALCSFGMSGWVFHAPFLDLHEGFELYAVWERSKNLAQEKYPTIITYRTYEELLNDAAIELIVVNTPNYTHFDLAKRALEAGKHVIVEKPFSITVKECETLIALAAEKKKHISVYQNRRWDSDYLTCKDVLDKKLLGEIVEAEIHFDRFSETLSYKIHKETPGAGSGNLYDLGSHLIDQAVQLFGLPNAVFADITAIRAISKVDDYFELIMFFDKLRVRIHSTYLAREASVGYIFHGTKGSFIKPKTNVQEAALVAGNKPNESEWGKELEADWGLLHTEINGEIIRKKVPSLAGHYLNYYEGVYQAIVNDKPLPVTAQEGLYVVKIIEAAYLSNTEKRVVQL